MKRKLIGLGAIALVLALLLTMAPACGNGDEGPTPGVTPTPGRTPTPGVTPTPTGEVKTLKIGFLGPLSGPAAAWGVPWEQGVKWAADTINERGGLKVGEVIYMIKVVSYDNKLSGSETATGASKLVYDDDVVYSTGGILVAENTAAQPIFHEAKVFGVGVGAGTVHPEFPYWLDTATHYPTWVTAFLDSVKAYNPDLRTIGLMLSESPLGHVVGDVTRNSLERLGWTLVAEEYMPAGTTDFYPALTKILVNNPDGLSFGGQSPGDAGLIVKQARELGYEKPIVVLGTSAYSVIQIAGCEYAEGYQSNEPYYGSPLFPEGTRELYREYVLRYHPEGDVLNFLTLLGYGGVMLYAQAVETAGTIDPDEVIKAFDDPDWRFDWFGAPDQKLGGMETYGIRRQVANYIGWAEIENCEPVMKFLQLSETP